MSIQSPTNFTETIIMIATMAAKTNNYQKIYRTIAGFFLNLVCNRSHRRTKNDQGIRESSKDREKKPPYDAWSQDLEKQLAPEGEIRRRLKHQEPVYDHQEEVPEHRGGAGKESVRGLALRGGGCLWEEEERGVLDGGSGAAGYPIGDS